MNTQKQRSYNGQGGIAYGQSRQTRADGVSVILPYIETKGVYHTPFPAPRKRRIAVSWQTCGMMEKS